MALVAPSKGHLGGNVNYSCCKGNKSFKGMSSRIQQQLCWFKIRIGLFPTGCRLGNGIPWVQYPAKEGAIKDTSTLVQWRTVPEWNLRKRAKANGARSVSAQSTKPPIEVQDRNRQLDKIDAPRKT